MIYVRIFIFCDRRRLELNTSFSGFDLEWACTIFNKNIYIYKIAETNTKIYYQSNPVLIILYDFQFILMACNVCNIGKNMFLYKYYEAELSFRMKLPQAQTIIKNFVQDELNRINIV